MNETATTLGYQLSIEDYREMVAHLCVKARPGQMLAMLPVMALVFVATYNLSLDHASDAARGIASGMLVAVGVLVLHRILHAWSLQRAQRKLDPRPDGPLLTHYTLAIRDDGLLVETASWRTELRWSAVTLAETKALLLLAIDTNAAYAVPKRAFTGPEHLARFRAELERRAAAGRP